MINSLIYAKEEPEKNDERKKGKKGHGGIRQRKGEWKKLNRRDIKQLEAGKREQR